MIAPFTVSQIYSCDYVSCLNSSILKMSTGKFTKILTDLIYVSENSAQMDEKINFHLRGLTFDSC